MRLEVGGCKNDTMTWHVSILPDRSLAGEAELLSLAVLRLFLILGEDGFAGKGVGSFDSQEIQKFLRVVRRVDFDVLGLVFSFRLSLQALTLLVMDFEARIVLMACWLLELGNVLFTVGYGLRPA